MLLTQDDLRRLTAEEKGELVKRQITKGDVRVEGMIPDRKGYVTISSADGSVRQVHYTKARTAYYKPGSIRLSKEEIEAGGTFGAVGIRHEVHHIPKAVWQDGSKTYVPRSTQQRLDSMTKRLVDGWKAGYVNETYLKEIAGEYWKAGMPISADRLREVAALRLNKVSEEQRAQEAKRTTKRPWIVRS